jgi:hypothetical protein
MSAETIRQGLTSVVDDAVNTLLLHTSELKGGMSNFFITKTKHEDVTKVIVAADSAATKLKLE